MADAANDSIAGPPERPDTDAAESALARPPGLLWNAFVMSWLRPATTAERLLRVGLPGAFAVHVASFVFLFLVATGTISLLREDSLFEIWGNLLSVIANHTAEFLLGFAIFVGFVEGILFALGLLLAPWAARDEKPRSSLRHALRCVWLQSMHLAVASWLMVCWAAFWDLMFYSNRYHATNVNWSDRPWYARNEETVFSAVATLLYGWVLWGMLRAAGARAPQRPAGVPPVCQACGYNLTAAAPEGACPECGEPVLASIGPEARPGASWEHREGAGWFDAWYATTSAAIRRPSAFGRALQVFSPSHAHRRFLLLAMPPAVLLGVLGAMFWCLGYLFTGKTYSSMLEDFLFLTLPLGGLLGGLAPLVIALAAAGLVGLVLSFQSGRNALPAGMRGAAYLSGLVLLGLAVNIPMAWLFGISSDLPWFDTAAAFLQIDDEAVAVIIWLAVDLAWLGFYGRSLLKIVRSARYADR